MFNIKQVKQNNKRFIVAALILIIPFFTFTARLIDWQIINTDYYKKRAQNNSAYTIKTEAVRGEIVDKDGEGIVINSTGYRVVIDRVEAGKDRENYVITKAVSLLESLNVPWRDTLPIGMNGEEYIFIEGKDSQVSLLKKYLRLRSSANAQDCMDKLTQKYNCEDFSKKDNSKLSYPFWLCCRYRRTRFFKPNCRQNCGRRKLSA